MNTAAAAASTTAQQAPVEPTTRRSARQKEKQQRNWQQEQNIAEAELLSEEAQPPEDDEINKLPRAKAAKNKNPPSTGTANVGSQEVLQSSATTLIQDAEDLGVLDDPEVLKDFETQLETFRRKTEREAQPLPHGIAEIHYHVGILEASLLNFQIVRNNDKRRRVFARLLLWLRLNVSAETINDICNSEATRILEGFVGTSGVQPNIFPNLSQFAKTWLGPFLIPPTRKTFTAKLFVEDTEEPRLSVTISLFLRDFLEAIVLRVAVNAVTGVGRVGKEYGKCGSLNDTHQTQNFKDAVKAAKDRFKDVNLKVCTVDLFSDGASLGISCGASIQPIVLEVTGGYRRFLRGSSEYFGKTVCLVGWVPSFRDVEVTEWRKSGASSSKASSSGKMAWNDLKQADKYALTRAVQELMYEELYQELYSAIGNRVFDLPFGIGNVVFVLSSFKGDQPEKNRWSNSIGCQICTKESHLILGDSHFRSRENQGRIHEDGFQVLSLDARQLLIPSDPWRVYFPPDIMHTWDNAVGHLMRLCALTLGESSKNKNQLKVGDTIVTAKAIDGTLMYVDGTGKQITVSNRERDISDRVTSRTTAAQQSEPWNKLKKAAIAFGGDQSRLLFNKEGSMKDREYGFGGLVLAVWDWVPVGDSTEIATCKKLKELVLGFYYILIRLQDAAPGFVLDKLMEKYTRCKDLWLELNADAGIVDIPISVHVFFHFPQMIQLFGAPMLYALYQEEGLHKHLRQTVLHNTNRVLGDSGEDYLQQALARQARRDLCEYWEAQSQLVTLGTPSFKTTVSPLPKDNKKMLKARGEKPDYRAKSIKVLKNLNLISTVWSSSSAFEYHFPVCQVSVVNEQGMTVVFPETILAICAIGNSQSLRIMAMAPDDVNYQLKRREVLEAVGACSDTGCFACSNIEYSSSLVLNKDDVTADQYFLPLAFRRDKKDKCVYASAIAVKVLDVENDDGGSVIRHLDVPSASEPVDINMNRFRDLCNLIKTSSNRYVLLERMRGRLS